MFALAACIEPYGTRKLHSRKKGLTEEGSVTREKGRRGGLNRTGSRDKGHDVLNLNFHMFCVCSYGRV